MFLLKTSPNTSFLMESIAVGYVEGGQGFMPSVRQGSFFFHCHMYLIRDNEGNRTPPPPKLKATSLPLSYRYAIRVARAVSCVILP